MVVRAILRGLPYALVVAGLAAVVGCILFWAWYRYRLYVIAASVIIATISLAYLIGEDVR